MIGSLYTNSDGNKIMYIYIYIYIHMRGKLFVLFHVEKMYIIYIIITKNLNK